MKRRTGTFYGVKGSLGTSHTGVERLRRYLAVGLISVSVLFSFYRGYQKQRTAKLAASVQTDAAGELSCSEVHRISTWSEERYGGKRGTNLHGAQFPKDVAKEIAKRLDPSRLLLLQTEVDDFAKGAVAPWSRFLQHRDCSYFDGWVFEQRQRLRESFHAKLPGILAKLSTPESKRDATSDDWELPKESYRGFAKDEAELNRRLEAYATQLNDTASIPLIAAYGNDRRRLVATVMEQGLFSENFQTRLLFAKGILAALDPYSTYFSSDEFDEFYSDLAGGVSGIGVRVRRVPRGYLVEGTIPDSPAAESGKVSEGDLIVALDGKRLVSVSDKEAKRLFKGAPNSIVRLTVEKPKSGATQVFSLVRRHFDFQEARVSSRVIVPEGEKGAVGVIQVPSFYGRGGFSDPDEHSSAEDFEAALHDILQGNQRVSGIVVDLRGNPGGYLEEAVSMAGNFLADAPVVAVVGQDNQRILRDDKTEITYGGPLVVLVDNDSASASEVLAGALKDHQRAVLVGTPHTYGKGSVQKLFHLGDEFLGAQWAGLPSSGVVKLTTSVFYSPLGHTPANGGVLTHIALAKSEAAQNSNGRIQDLAPFVDEPQLARIGEKRNLLESHVQELRMAFSPGEEAKKLEGEGRAKGAELDGAVDIAAELAAIEIREASAARSAVSRKP